MEHCGTGSSWCVFGHISSPEQRSSGLRALSERKLHFIIKCHWLKCHSKVVNSIWKIPFSCLFHFVFCKFKYKHIIQNDLIQQKYLLLGNYKIIHLWMSKKKHVLQLIINHVFTWLMSTQTEIIITQILHLYKQMRYQIIITILDTFPLLW